MDIVAQAAILIERIVFNHPFVDGNKRTALIAGSVFLLVNNLKIVPTSDEEELIYAKEIERLILSKDREHFLQWLRAHIHKLIVKEVNVMKEETKAKKNSQKPTPAMPVQKAIEISMKQFEKELEYLKDR
ncbi:hypothetical protein KSX_18430 [Ktedonospora formicarum]|uniref:Fido domain-containing protein n=1 Tax=Ktedonospora formicarum TaxID=2778364 RepID=A0A8J3HYX8_9CHLR|nr:hypothetical protein KSX_18430 [Ktedonospora formicarum]